MIKPEHFHGAVGASKVRQGTKPAVLDRPVYRAAPIRIGTDGSRSKGVRFIGPRFVATESIRAYEFCI